MSEAFEVYGTAVEVLVESKAHYSRPFHSAAVLVRVFDTQPKFLSRVEVSTDKKRIQTDLEEGGRRDWGSVGVVPQRLFDNLTKAMITHPKVSNKNLERIRKWYHLLALLTLESTLPIRTQLHPKLKIIVVKGCKRKRKKKEKPPPPL